MTDEFLPGMAFEESRIVGKEDTAEFHGSGDLPVYATPSMVALMEYTAKELVKPLLAEGETTVGTRMEISHLKATPVGNKVRAKATLREIHGRKVSFTIEAYDGETLIGQAVHERAVVDRERFMAGLKKQ
ncbi:MAG TPA: thioesterase family protein [Proteiniclasticum sp.]|nr:thioesterase family protein [Proteiniclasticum sp.]